MLIILCKPVLEIPCIDPIFFLHQSMQQTLLHHVTICTSAVYGGPMRVEVNMKEIDDFLSINITKITLINLELIMLIKAKAIKREKCNKEH